MAKKTKDKAAEEPTKASKAEPRPEKKKAAPPPEPETDETDEAGEADEADEESTEQESEGEGEGALVVRGGESEALDPGERAAADELPSAASEALEEEEEVAATSLGSQRYVMAGFFAAAMILAFVLGKLIHGVWSAFSNKDWFSQSVPALAAVPDDDKTTYGMIAGSVIAIVYVVRQYRKADVRTWTDEVAAELSKVKWPTRKEVSNSTIVVIAASTVATVYLALLDRLWSFVTNLVYGSGT